jgi:hypothetical protein
MICRDCGIDFIPIPNKPGFINQCEDCSIDVPVYKAEQGTDDSGVVETVTKKGLMESVSKLFGD